MSSTSPSIEELTPEQARHLLAGFLCQTETETYPLSLAQQRLWFLEQFAPGTSAYNVPVALRLKGKLDPAMLASSLQQMVRRHAILRTTFVMQEGRTVQVVRSEGEIPLPLKDLRVLPADERESEAWRAAKEEAAAPFDLAVGPLLRSMLLQINDEEHIFVCVLHHIVCDAWSISIFLRELAALYGGHCEEKAVSLPEPAIQYGDYAQWQQEWITSDLLTADLGYWKKKLAGQPEILDLAPDRERPLEQTYAGATQSVAIDDAAIETLQALARSSRTTLFTVLLAAFHVLAYAYSGSEDIVLGVPAAGRPQVELEALIGFFVNTVVLRTDLTGDPAFSDLLARVRETALEAFAHAEVPFERLVEELKPRRSMSHNPIFQVMFSAIKDGSPAHFGPLTTAPYVLSSGGSPFDLSVTLIEDTAGHWWVTLEYNTGLFDYDCIAKMLTQYLVLLPAIGRKPASTISALAKQMYTGSEPADSLVNPAPTKPAHRRLRFQTLLSKPPSDLSRASDALEQILIPIWERTLGVPHISVHDDFFDLGGHSLLAARLVADVAKVIGRKVPLAALFRGPTLGSFADLIRHGRENNPDPLLMQIKAGQQPIPLFAIAAPGVETLGYALLARHIGEQQSLFKIQSAAEAASLPYTADELEVMAQEYVAALRAFQPQGPYCLIATCGGVHIAERMVHLLEARGDEVGFFGIIDTWVLENRYVRPLARLDSLQRRVLEVSRLPARVQISLYRRAAAKRVRSLVLPTPDHVSPWDRAYYPARGFRPKRFQAPVLLFKRPKQPYFCTRDPELGWGLRSARGVEIHPIDTAHEAMLREPAVQIIGEKITHAIARHRMDDSLDRRMPSRLHPAASPVTTHA